MTNYEVRNNKLVEREYGEGTWAGSCGKCWSYPCVCGGEYFNVISEEIILELTDENIERIKQLYEE